MHKTIYFKRTWLNRPRNQSFAAIIAEVSLETWKVRKKNKDDGEEQNLNASLQISDCSRNISLDFNVYGHRGVTKRRDTANVRFKVETLRKTVNEFCDAVIAGIEEMEDVK